MAIINCPNCNKKTSQLSSRCPHCGYDRGQEDNARKVELERRSMRDKVYHLKMTSYGVITLFLAAFGWYWWDTGGYLNRSSVGPIISVALSAIAYLAIRVQLFRTKRQQRKIGR